MAAGKAKTETRTIAQYTGHAGVRRVLTRSNQDTIVGASGAGTRDLVWEPGNAKLDVSDVAADVIEYLKGDPKFSVKEVEVAVDAAGTDDGTP